MPEDNSQSLKKYFSDIDSTQLDIDDYRAYFTESIVEHGDREIPRRSQAGHLKRLSIEVGWYQKKEHEYGDLAPHRVQTQKSLIFFTRWGMGRMMRSLECQDVVSLPFEKMKRLNSDLSE